MPRDAAPEPPEVESAPATEQKQAPAYSCERWFGRLMEEELSELDRHMLTKELQRVMLSETSRIEDSET
ncbi:hypothetical protein GCM10015535_67220 [Streptomyces gelaticus]|uniref:Uncharacterized protein n=1 Tax=Streptomyces gelaticus TaxID=285446 RepID=A0ABQ2WBN4_9ACTN|nr:hypothetical protein GCM10015535_67220 [Streptomyces gelaticus]